MTKLDLAARVLGNKAKEGALGLDGAHGDAAEGMGHGDLVCRAVNHLDALEAQNQRGVAGLVGVALECRDGLWWARG